MVTPRAPTSDAGVRQGLLFFGEGMAFAEDPPWRRRLCGQEPRERERARQDLPLGFGRESRVHLIAEIRAS